MACMGEALRTISFKVKTASCGGTQCFNSFGDEQLAVDLLANKLLFEVSLSVANELQLDYIVESSCNINCLCISTFV